MQSCDSVLRKNSDEFLESYTLKSFNRTPKEEMKLVSSPKGPKKEKKPKKKAKKQQKGTRMPLSQARNYTSQVNSSFINKSNNKMGSPGFVYQNKIQARDFKNKMNKMLDVNANNINESQNSVISSPSKLKLENTLSYKNKFNEAKGAANEECKIPVKRDSRFFAKMVPSSVELPKADSYKDLSEDFTSEFGNQSKTNKVKMFEHNSMDLKGINSKRLKKG